MAELATLTLHHERTTDSLTIGELLDFHEGRWGQYTYPHPFVMAAVEAGPDGSSPEYPSPELVRGMVGVSVNSKAGLVVEHATVAAGEVMYPDRDDVVEHLGEAVAKHEARLTGQELTPDRVTAIICQIGSLAGVLEYQEAQ